MTRPLRIEFPGALYHVTARGDNRTSIYLDHDDRLRWLDILGLICTRFNFIVHAYCQMDNHYHIMVETVEANLSGGMRQLNAIYSQHFNRTHRRCGHVLQGRYKAILVQKESYLLELARYVVLNPVRAGVVSHPRHWRWGSYRHTTGEVDAPAWLETEWLLSQFAHTQEQARVQYEQFVLQGIGKSSPLKEAQHQLLLGDKIFVAQHTDRFMPADLTAAPRVQRRVSAKTLDHFHNAYSNRDEAIGRAYATAAYSMAEIARHFSVSYKTVSRAVRWYESEFRNS
jgi:putative transposase